MSTTPRDQYGRPLHQLGRGYLVLVDLDHEEVSRRATGVVWLEVPRPVALGLLSGSLIFHPDSTDSAGLVSLLVTGSAAHYLGWGTDDHGLVYAQNLSVPSIDTGGRYLVDCFEALGAMR